MLRGPALSLLMLFGAALAVSNPNRMCVATSRAKERLIVVGDGNTLRCEHSFCEMIYSICDFHELSKHCDNLKVTTIRNMATITFRKSRSDLQ